MRNFNCARVNVGSYLADTNEYCHSVKCGYTILRGSVSVKELKPIKVRQHQTDDFAILQTVVIYPTTDEVIISVFNGKGKHQVQLDKLQNGKQSTLYKMRL